MSKHSRVLAAALAGAALACLTGAAEAAGPITDPLGDFIPSFTGVRKSNLS